MADSHSIHDLLRFRPVPHGDPATLFMLDEQFGLSKELKGQLALHLIDLQRETLAAHLKFLENARGVISKHQAG